MYICVTFMDSVHIDLCSTGNTNTGHDIVSSTDESLALQTPAVDFVLLNQSVSSLCMIYSSYIYMLFSKCVTADLLIVLCGQTAFIFFLVGVSN